MEKKKKEEIGVFLSVVLPTYNERKNVIKLIYGLESFFLEKKINVEIIVVDDSSPDGTSNEIKKLQKKFLNLFLVEGKEKKGIGDALRRGFFAAKGEWLLSMDADGSVLVKEIPLLLREIENGYDLVCGSKYLTGSIYEKQSVAVLFRSFISELGNKYISLVTGIPVRDFSLNFRLLKKKVWNEISPLDNQNFFLVEMIVQAHKKNFKIKEVPASFLSRSYGNSKTKVWSQSAKFLIKATKYLLRKEQ